jgi:hypothetical protein
MVLLLAGCASVETIGRQYSEVNTADGVTAAEGKSIAQEFLLSQGMGERYAVSVPQLDSTVLASYPEWKGKAWVVCFSSKSLDLLNPYNRERFVVAVDQTNGNIRFYQYGPKMAPTEMRTFGEAGLPASEWKK